MTERLKITTFQVVKKDGKARLQLREFDGTFVYKRPLDSGTIDNMRETSRRYQAKDGVTVHGELDLDKLAELKKEARIRHATVTKQ